MNEKKKMRIRNISRDVETVKRDETMTLFLSKCFECVRLDCDYVCKIYHKKIKDISKERKCCYFEQIIHEVEG